MIKPFAAIALLACLSLPGMVRGQETWRFEKDIRAFEREDSVYFPLKGGIVFTGSSSIRKWTDLRERFPGYAITQRGFGGSQLSDVTHYAGRILIPYRPSKIFLYAGDNDLAAGQSAEEVYAEFLEFHKLMSDSLPDTKVYYIAAKPSPSRAKLLPVYREFNGKVKSFIEEHPCNWTFIDVYGSMVDGQGQPREELFIEDMLHMNDKGYDIWETLIRPFL